MAHYLVHARSKPDRLSRLRDLLAQNAFLPMRRFGRALTTR